MGTLLRVLITVKTYPLPSTAVQEFVCTAGVLEDGTFIRLVPIDYRYRPYWEWYKKYQWIEVEVVKNKHDPRPESFTPVPERSIVPLELIDTKHNWATRRKHVLAKGTRTMCDLYSCDQKDVSLGIIRPRQVIDLIIEDAERQWKPEWQALFIQQRIFGPNQKPLEKIPFKFSYKFLCEDPDCTGHQMMIEDWEVGQLFRSMRDKYGDEKVAAAKVRDKFFTNICGPSYDPHFYVGTVLTHGTWIILGVFWPKR